MIVSSIKIQIKCYLMIRNVSQWDAFLPKFLLYPVIFLLSCHFYYFGLKMKADISCKKKKEN